MLTKLPINLTYPQNYKIRYISKHPTPIPNVAPAPIITKPMHSCTLYPSPSLFQGLRRSTHIPRIFLENLSITIHALPLTTQRYTYPREREREDSARSWKAHSHTRRPRRTGKGESHIPKGKLCRRRRRRKSRAPPTAPSYSNDELAIVRWPRNQSITEEAITLSRRARRKRRATRTRRQGFFAAAAAGAAQISSRCCSWGKGRHAVCL